MRWTLFGCISRLSQPKSILLNSISMWKKNSTHIIFGNTRTERNQIASNAFCITRMCFGKWMSCGCFCYLNSHWHSNSLKLNQLSRVMLLCIPFSSCAYWFWQQIQTKIINSLNTSIMNANDTKRLTNQDNNCHPIWNETNKKKPKEN